MTPTHYRGHPHDSLNTTSWSLAMGHHHGAEMQLLRAINNYLCNRKGLLFQNGQQRTLMDVFYVTSGIVD